MKALNEKDLDTLIEKLRGFLSQYSYRFKDKHINLLSNLMNFSRSTDYERKCFLLQESTRYFEIASFLNILTKAHKERGITTIKHSRLKLEMQNFDLIDFLWTTMNNLLFQNRHDDYMELFDWETREGVLPEKYTQYRSKMTEEEYEDMIKQVDYSEYNATPYNKDEIITILDYEKKRMDSLQKLDKQALSYFLNEIVEVFKKDGIFSTKQKTISTDDACFLYEYLQEIGITEDRTKNNKDKYDFIKNELSKLNYIEPKEPEDDYYCLIP